MTDTMLSIVIPVYNGGDTVSNCLEKIYEQGLDTSLFEVLCINDCSTDDTQARLEQFADKHANLTLVNHDTNKRQGGARNTGISIASGRYILFIDHDDYFLPDSLNKVLVAVGGERRGGGWTSCFAITRPS